jgi:peroxiredoxin
MKPVLVRKANMRSVFFFVWIWAAFGIYAQPIQIAEIGSRVESFQLADVSGAGRTLQSYSGRTVVLVFWSFKCPVSLAYQERMEMLQDQYRGKGVTVLGISSGSNEAAADIQANILNLKFKIPVLLDSDGIAAEKLGATHTPSVFILDGSSVLRYRGSIDNNKRVGDKTRIAYAEDAISAILAGQPVSIPETRVFGCSIKR